MLEKKFAIEGMNCQHCVKSVEVELEELKVDSFNVEIGCANVKYDETIVKEEHIINAISEAGFKVI